MRKSEKKSCEIKLVLWFILEQGVLAVLAVLQKWCNAKGFVLVFEIKKTEVVLFLIRQ